MNNKLKPIIPALGLGLALASGSAVSDVTFFSPVTIFEDNDLDWLIETGEADGIIDQSETLVSVFEIDTTSGVFAGQGPAGFGGDELTGIAVLHVAQKIDNQDGTFGFVFGPQPEGMNSILATLGVGPVPDGNAGQGAMAALWLDPTPNLQIVPPDCDSLNECAQAAADGDLWEVDGFSGDAADVWFADDAPDDTNALKQVAPTTKVGFFNFNVTILTNNTGQTLEPRVIGSGDLLGGEFLTNGAFARSDFDFQKTPVVPEPSSLALLAVGLLGFGVAQRKRSA